MKVFIQNAFIINQARFSPERAPPPRADGTATKPVSLNIERLCDMLINTVPLLAETKMKEDFMQDRLNALETALRNEMAEHEFYVRHAERTLNIFGKMLFRKIAGEEVEHYEKLKALHDLRQKEERWPETIPLSVKGTQVKAFIRAMKQETADITAGNDDDLKAVRTALRFEAKGRDFYASLREASQDPGEKAFFDLLSGIEQDHYRSLLEAEEYLIDPAAWYRKKDKSGWLDGGA